MSVPVDNPPPALLDPRRTPPQQPHPCPPTTRHAGRRADRRHGWWWKTLLVGIPLWVATVLITAITANSNLIPTVILIGSFLVPFSVALYAAERLPGHSAARLPLPFAIGGVCGVLGASLLEAPLHAQILLFVLVGLIEELVKGIIITVVGARTRLRGAHAGALLGATVGAGFAAFESAGYAFNASLTPGGLDLAALVHVEVTRALLAPLGHILWSAALGAAIFGSVDSRIMVRIMRAVAAWAAVAMLHALWDSSGELSTVIALLSHGGALTDLQRDGSLPALLATEVSTTATWAYVALIAAVTASGVLGLWIVMRSSTRTGRSS